MRYLRPFIYGDKIFVYSQLQRNPNEVILNGIPYTVYDFFYELHSTTDGVTWEFETEIPTFNDRPLISPKTIIVNNRILMYGSYEVATNLDDKIHVVELFDN